VEEIFPERPAPERRGEVLVGGRHDPHVD
jgi:hypothetical protein